MESVARNAFPYKVVEITDVTDARIEEALNLWAAQGYRFDSVHFVTQPGSRRPMMAFLMFSAPRVKRRAAG